MVPLDRALASSYRLSIVTMSLSGAVWPQFATQSFIQRVFFYRNSKHSVLACSHTEKKAQTSTSGIRQDGCLNLISI